MDTGFLFSFLNNILISGISDCGTSAINESEEHSKQLWYSYRGKDAVGDSHLARLFSNALTGAYQGEPRG